MSEKVILFYKFTPVSDPETTMFWQRSLCQKLGLKGRVLISKHGINGTLGGEIRALKDYAKEMNIHPQFKGIEYKWSEGSADDFPRCCVKVKDEIVAFGAAEEIEVDKNGVVGGGKHLKPAALHKLMADKGDEVIFYDGRNAYEAKIGKFENAIVPDVDTSKDFLKDIETGEISKYKDKPIVTYCTGGIRCEILSSLMKKRGYEEVYQMDGGIVKYGERYKNSGYWKGKLYIFDERMVTSFSDEAEDLGDCIHCENKTSNFENCMNKQCNQLILVCQDCAQDTACSERCRKLAPFAVKKTTTTVV